MKKIFVLTFLIAHFMAANGVAFASKEEFNAKMNSIIREVEKKGGKIAVHVISLNKGDTIFSHNGNAPLNPSSCMEIVTAVTALKLLGPNHTFHTRFFTDRPAGGGTVTKLWVKGHGDPSITMERLWKTARDIANTGLKKIDGDIVIDDYYFDGYQYPGFEPESILSNNLPTGAVSLNHNMVTVAVAPASVVGHPPSVTLDTAGPYFRIINTAKTGAKGSAKTITATRTKSGEEDILQIGGMIPIESPPERFYRNITNPPLYFGLALKSLMEQNGIEISGQVLRQLSPRGGVTILDEISKPLSLILRDMNSLGGNFIAEQIVKILGAEIGDGSGSTREGLSVIKNFLRELKIPMESYTLVNGSGVTGENKITASALTTALASALSDPQIAPEINSSLSIIGLDAATKDRHNVEQISGLARVKIGSSKDVSAMTGTIYSTNGETLAYTILMNGTAIDWRTSIQTQNDLLGSILSFTR